jgi:hypothetical protein
VLARHLPRKRMFSCAAADNEDLHAESR